jgi:hypothetical protein
MEQSIPRSASDAELDGREGDGAVVPFRRPVQCDTGITHSPLTVREAVGDVLRDERLRQQRTLTDVAKSASVSLPYLSEVERGRKEASSDVLSAIGGALALPMPDLLERAAQRLRVHAERTNRAGYRIEMRLAA